MLSQFSRQSYSQINETGLPVMVNAWNSHSHFCSFAPVASHQ
ncbi:hypothetical protein GPUN_1957 [Glaciecola punicea ACAM 611]|uniref:Uncharacterized protein n=1 Tax=Glaciecola punicea ACAM 611 TaxID=1121923 RepID=H5TCP5_9ALTE|nr:hypothetical protein GPUN_1957 [Glaciecola punicea ACAM 611]